VQKIIEAETFRFSMVHYTTLVKADTESLPKYAAAGNEVIHLPDSDLDVFKKAAIPLWFKWANKDKDAARVLKIILDVMRNPMYNILDEKDVEGFELKL
jgi:TRAP-type C4-dicarboxylate transport system substrate-binding protein